MVDEEKKDVLQQNSESGKPLDENKDNAEVDNKNNNGQESQSNGEEKVPVDQVKNPENVVGNAQDQKLKAIKKILEGTQNLINDDLAKSEGVTVYSTQGPVEQGKPEGGNEAGTKGDQSGGDGGEGKEEDKPEEKKEEGGGEEKINWKENLEKALMIAGAVTIIIILIFAIIKISGGITGNSVKTVDDEAVSGPVDDNGHGNVEVEVIDKGVNEEDESSRKFVWDGDEKVEVTRKHIDMDPSDDNVLEEENVVESIKDVEDSGKDGGGDVEEIGHDGIDSEDKGDDNDSVETLAEILDNLQQSLIEQKAKILDRVTIFDD